MCEAGKCVTCDAIRLLEEQHRAYHETGMCYGDSHAGFVLEIERTEADHRGNDK